ncbi:MAG: CBS domain-containing protein [Candidatus Thermoplasmatota archaeon]
MKVKEVMTEDIITVNKNVSLKYVLKLMKKNEITKIPITEDDKVVGIVTDNIIAYKLGSIRNKGVPASKLHASSVKEEEFKAVKPDTDLNLLLKTVGEPGPTMIIILDKKEKLVGVLTKADLLPLIKSRKKLRDIMKKDLNVVSKEDRVIHARRKMIDNDIARLPVLSEGKLAGMISDMEIAFAFSKIKKQVPLGRQKHQLEELLVEDAMEKPVIYTDSEKTAEEAAKIMLEENVGALPILEKNELSGIVTRTDLIKTISTL